jgi:uncharacterized membrane protein
VRGRVSRPVVALASLMGLYVAVFGTLTWQQQSNFGTFGFDMGIYDQGIWLLSRFHRPFDTVRGLNYFGHHVNPITVLFVPMYWLGAGPHFLYLVETVWMAAGAVPIWLLARDRLANPWLAVSLAGAYLLYPSLEWMNWWHFHPDTLIIAPLMFAWWLARRGRWRWFWVAVAVALLCKEDAALAVMVLGLVVARWFDRRTGLLTAAAGAAWFVVCGKVIIPWANHGLAPFYAELFPGFGNSLTSIAYNMVRHPSRILHRATAGGVRSARTYYWQLLAPVAFMPFLAVPVLLIAGPQTVINVVSGLPYTHDFKYHYSSIVTAAVFLATIEGIAIIRQASWRHFLVGAVLASALATNVAWSPSPLGHHLDDGTWARHAVARHAADNAAMRLVPRSAGVAATYYLVPHLDHRVHIYEWPNPFVAANWGVVGSPPPDPSTADWLVLDRTLLGDTQALFERLTGPGGAFRVVFDRDEVVVARRRVSGCRAASPAPRRRPPPCGSAGAASPGCCGRGS